MQDLINYEKKKRDEMTFGYFADKVAEANLVPDLFGSVAFYDTNTLRNKMLALDDAFVGTRRSAIDKMAGTIRQLIHYTVVSRVVDGDVQVAVYKRSKGSEERLEGSRSFGWGGHVELMDLVEHFVTDDSGNPVAVPGSVSSHYSTIQSGMRELSEEAGFFTAPEFARPLEPQEMVEEILSHLKFTNVLNHQVTRQEELDDVSGSVVVKGNDYVMVDELDGTGKLFWITPIAPDVIYRDLFGKEPTTNRVKSIDTELTSVGFLSDLDPENPSHVGNTHIAVIGVITVPSDLFVETTEDNYSTVGWVSLSAIGVDRDLYEPWSRLLIDSVDQLSAVIREKDDERLAFIASIDAEVDENSQSLVEPELA